jgi:thiamine-monophosphate kinase
LSDLRRRLPAGPPGEVWIGDDAAVLRPPEGPLLLAADALVEGLHWDPALTGFDDAGWKALAVNVSDVAAMGGRPLHAVVTVTVPSGRAGDVDRMYDGIEAAAKALDCPIVGGDLTGGPALVVTVAVTGTVDGTPVLRSGARPGDLLLVTGALGAASAALRERRPPPRVAPRVAEGTAARLGGATAMLDLSDGLSLDLSRLCQESGVGARVQLPDLPLAPGLVDLAEATGVDPFDLALHGGEDYELLAALPPRAVEGARQRVVERFGTRLTAIGEVTEDREVVAVRGDEESPLEPKGWDHFA